MLMRMKGGNGFKDGSWGEKTWDFMVVPVTDCLWEFVQLGLGVGLKELRDEDQHSAEGQNKIVTTEKVHNCHEISHWPRRTSDIYSYNVCSLGPVSQAVKTEFSC